MPGRRIFVKVHRVVIPVILPHGPNSIDVGVVQIKKRIRWTPIGSHVPRYDAMHQHVWTIFELHPEAVGGSGGCGPVLFVKSTISRRVGKLVVIGNHGQQLGFSGETKSSQEIPGHAARWAVVDPGRSPKGCVGIGNPTIHATHSTPGSKGCLVHDIGLVFKLRIALPVPVGNIDALSCRLLQKFFKAPNEPSENNIV